MSHEILLRQFKLGSEEKPFVLAGVLRTEGPTAIKAGNKALILADGKVDGWIGGHCTEDEIVRNALECLREGKTRFLNLTTCQGGRMDVYLEPYLPKRRILIFGHVPIVEALAHFAKSLNFSVMIVDKRVSKENFPEVDKVFHSVEDDEIARSLAETPNQTYAVIATMGESDLEHVTKLCRLNLPYIGVVAGKKRASEIYTYLRSIDIREEQIERIKAPAGIYIRAVTAEEIALSVMAEIVEIARGQKDTREFTRESVSLPTLDTQAQAGSGKKSAIPMIDPVCGMTVSDSSDYSLKLNGQSIFFCCATCKESFVANPQQYILAKSS